jgi:hypothetical protein
MRNLELHRELHRVIESAIAKKAKQVQRWREDHITLAWLEELEDSAVFSAPAAGPLDIKMATWKLSGRAENMRGDVAVIARIRHPQTSSHYEGAAFLEAKRSDTEPPYKYSSFDASQYQRFKDLSAHRYLFYRRSASRAPPKLAVEVVNILEVLDDFVLGRRGVFTPDSLVATLQEEVRRSHALRLTHTSTVPTYLLQCFPTPLGDGIFSAGISLASQIHRYCHGWDLGPPLPPDQPVAVPDDVPFILTVAAGHGGAERPSLPEVPDGYVRVGAGEDFRPRDGGMTMR